MMALVLAILPVVPGFMRAAVTPGGQVASPRFLDALYTYAWFVTFGLSFALYLLIGHSELASVVQSEQPEGRTLPVPADR